ncbi:Facilitated trehalose transporter Tret1-1 [Gryllus bimaculatus]|nr:Facilitated trehalose transporter Tret1-1 [Gryllus bimaculatus]
MASASQTTLALSVTYDSDVTSSLGPQHDWVPLLCVLVFTVAFSLGISPISWLLIGELFPLECRELGGALATCFSYVCAFVGVKTFVDFRQALGLHGAFWLYAAVSLAGLGFVVVCVPETKGRDLDELHPKLAGASGPARSSAAAAAAPAGFRLPGCGGGAGGAGGGFCGTGAAPGVERCA